MSLLITMDGKYAERRSPCKRVRVLCVDRAPGPPVVVLDANGGICTYRANGQYYESNKSEYDLVPLDETLVVTPGRYRTRGGQIATICYTRSGETYKNYLALGWIAPHITAHTWRLDGRFSNDRTSDLDLVERIGDLP